MNAADPQTTLGITLLEGLRLERKGFDALKIHQAFRPDRMVFKSKSGHIGGN